MSETPVPTRIPAQVWNEINTETMKDVLTPHAQTNAHIWTAISEVVFRLARAGVIVDPSDADHAVALEREAIAAWHERQARAAQEHAHGLPLESNRHQLLAEDFAVHKTAARKIRNGDHNANTPPNAQKQGQDAR